MIPEYQKIYDCSKKQEKVYTTIKKSLLQRLFHKHSYELIDRVGVRSSWSDDYIIYVQRCRECGKIRQTKV